MSETHGLRHVGWFNKDGGYARWYCSCGTVSRRYPNKTAAIQAHTDHRTAESKQGRK